MNNSNLAIRAKHKIVFLGDTAVGKTSIIHQFMYGTFDLTHHSTIGIDYLSKIVNTATKSMRLQIWDTAGQERFRALVPSYIRDASAIVIVYDVTCRKSFEALDNWLTTVRDVRGEQAVVILVGNKIDLGDQRQVTSDEAETKSRELNLDSYETSADWADSVNHLFSQIADKMPDHDQESVRSQNEVGSIKIEKSASEKAKQTNAD